MLLHKSLLILLLCFCCRCQRLLLYDLVWLSFTLVAFLFLLWVRAAEIVGLPFDTGIHCIALLAPLRARLVLRPIFLFLLKVFPVVVEARVTARVCGNLG